MDLIYVPEVVFVENDRPPDTIVLDRKSAIPRKTVVADDRSNR